MGEAIEEIERMDETMRKLLQRLTQALEAWISQMKIYNEVNGEVEESVRVDWFDEEYSLFEFDQKFQSDNL